MAKANEPGVFIGKINPSNPSRAFLGYVDKQASEKKIVRDVFKHGDSAFISGKSAYFATLKNEKPGNLQFKHFVHRLIKKILFKFLLMYYYLLYQNNCYELVQGIKKNKKVIDVIR